MAGPTIVLSVLGAIGLFIVVAFVRAAHDLTVAEFKGWVYKLTQLAIDAAVKGLPADCQEDQRKEWEGDLAGEYSKRPWSGLCFAIFCVWLPARRVARSLDPRSRVERPSVNLAERIAPKRIASVNGFSLKQQPVSINWGSEASHLEARSTTPASIPPAVAILSRAVVLRLRQIGQILYWVGLLIMLAGVCLLGLFFIQQVPWYQDPNGLGKWREPK